MKPSLFFAIFLGPVFGFTLMNYGGFSVPFFTIGVMGILFALFLVVAIPDVKKVRIFKELDQHWSLTNNWRKRKLPQKGENLRN